MNKDRQYIPQGPFLSTAVGGVKWCCECVRLPNKVG